MSESPKPYTPEEWDQEETLEDGSPLPRGYGSQHPATKYEDDPRLRATVLALVVAQARIEKLLTHIDRLRHWQNADCLGQFDDAVERGDEPGPE